MKKFLVIIISLIVTVSLGFTVYAFIKNNEQIKLIQANYYINSGEEFEVDFAFTNKKKQTKITYDLENAGGIEKTDVDNVFVGVAGGQFTFKALTTNKNFPEFTISITVGDGSEKYPYYIKSTEDFLKLADESKAISKNYILTTDLDLTGVNFTGFGTLSGKFDGNGHTISNATYNAVSATSYVKPMASQSVVDIAMFKEITSKGKVLNLTLNNFNFNGSFSNAAIVAVTNNGVIKNVNVKSSKITNSSTSTNSRNAGIAVINQSISDNQARIDRVISDVEINAQANVAGVAVYNRSAIIINSYSLGALNSTSANTRIAGLVIFNMAINNVSAYVKDCYSICKISENAISKASLILDNDSTNNIIRGCYYSDDFTNCEVGVTSYTSTNYNVNRIAIEDMGNLNNFISYSTVSSQLVKWSTVVWYIGENGYPTIDFSASDVSDDLGVSVNPDNEITSLADLVSAFSVASNSSTHYLLAKDIDLSSVKDFTPLGIYDNSVIPFNGIFEAAYNDAESRYFTIKNLTITSDRENNGLFAQLGETAQILNLRLENVKISGGTNVGAVTGINNGLIDNCEIVHAENDGIGGSNVFVANLGGIVGINNGTILNSKADININARTYSSVGNVGGIAGSNNNTIYNTVYTSSSAEENKKSKIQVIGLHIMYVGGIVGSNSSVISYCLNNNAIISNMTGENVIGGICGYAFNDAKFISCNVTSNVSIEGNKVGGVVGHSQKSQVKECFVEATIKGHQVGGVAFTAPEIVIQDANIQCYLNGRDNGSRKAGIAVELFDNNASYCGPVFMAVTFDDVGQNFVTSYFVTNAAWPWEWNPNGIKVEKAIFDKTTMGNAKRWILGDIIGFNQLAVNQDGGCSVDVCLGYQGTSVFTNKGFSTLVWSFEQDNYPQLINVKTMQ